MTTQSTLIRNIIENEEGAAVVCTGECIKLSSNAALQALTKIHDYATVLSDSIVVEGDREEVEVLLMIIEGLISKKATKLKKKMHTTATANSQPQ